MSGLLALLLIAVLGFGWHIRTVYNGFVASTDQGDPLFEAPVLEHYGQQILDDLARRDVLAAIVSRAGQPREKLPKGVHYTHSAFFTRRADGGYDVHNLYHGEDNRLRSSLVTDTPADFLRLLREKDAGVIIPDTATQAQLYAFIGSAAYRGQHRADYSLISNPFDTRWQNCNEFMLYALAAMVWEMEDAEAIRARLSSTITPTILPASIIRRHIGPKIDERLIMADHGRDIQTTTAADLAEFLESQGRLAETYRIEFDDPPNSP